MTAAFDFDGPDLPVGGYRMELEDREHLRASSTPAILYGLGDVPEKVDPRKHPLAGEGFLKVENQGSIGSCQGNALTECAEFAYVVRTGKVTQLSRMMAYLASQMKDNIRGDSGSTLSGGTKAATEGICREEIAPYPSRYPGWGWITDAMREDAKNYKLKSHTEITSVDQMKAYIGSGIGIVQIGISWNNTMTPDARGCITRWSAGGGGGHSVVYAGYLPDADVGAQSSAGYWFLLKNSWGRNWGMQGYAYVDPRVVAQQLSHNWSTFIGRSDMETPTPRKLPVDFTKESLLS